MVINIIETEASIAHGRFAGGDFSSFVLLCGVGSLSMQKIKAMKIEL